VISGDSPALAGLGTQADLVRGPDTVAGRWRRRGRSDPMSSVPRSVSATPSRGRRAVSLATVALLVAALLSMFTVAAPATARQASTPSADGGEMTLVVW